MSNAATRGFEGGADRVGGEVLGSGRLGQRDLLGGHDRRLQAGSAARRARRLGDVHADAVPHRKLDARPVLHLQAGDLPPVDGGREADRIDPAAHEHRRPVSGRDGQRRLAQPARHRSLAAGALLVDEEQRHEPVAVALAHDAANDDLGLVRVGHELS